MQIFIDRANSINFFIGLYKSHFQEKVNSFVGQLLGIVIKSHLMSRNKSLIGTQPKTIQNKVIFFSFNFSFDCIMGRILKRYILLFQLF